MRKKDLQKVSAIKEAVYDILITEGYQKLSMSKIAKKAGVSQATIYLTYENKEDMLTSLYVEAKDMLDSQTKVDLNTHTDIEIEIKRLFQHYIKTLLAHPKQALFMNAVNNTPALIEKNVYREMMNRNGDINELIAQGQQNGIIAKMPFSLLVAFTFNALNSLMEVSYSKKQQMTDQDISAAVDLCWKVMKA